MAEPSQALSAYLEERLPAYLAELEQLSSIECPTSSKVGVDEAGGWVERWAVARGWQLEVVPSATVGASVIVTVRGAGRLQVLLAAHLDTVYPVGTAAARPLRVEDGRLIGPGTCDNKSGLLSGLYAMAALEDLGLLPAIGAITLVCGGDEETDMESSGALLAELAPGYDLALVLEAGRENGDISDRPRSAGASV